MNSKLMLFRRSKLMPHIALTMRAPHDHHWPKNEPKPHDLEAPPSDDEIIKIHYLKHYTHWEFKNYEDLHIDSYRYYLRYRFEHMGQDTDPIPNHVLEDMKPRHKYFWYIAPIVLFVVFYNELTRSQGRRYALLTLTPIGISQFIHRDSTLRFFKGIFIADYFNKEGM